MADCPYCVGNHFVAAKIEGVARIEVNVVPDIVPRLDVKVNRYDGILEMHAGFSISYCPMCGRRLTPHDA